MTQNKGDNWVRIFQVTDPKKHKNGFTIYKVTSVVFPKNAPEAVTNIIVWKRFNDFKKLHSTLKIHHKNCNITEELPKLSKSKYFNRFEDEIIQERIHCALEFLNFIGRHPPLFTCVPFLQFFNSSYQVSDTISDNESSLTNGNLSHSTSDLCNNTEKCHLYGEITKDDKSLIDSDIQSDDEFDSFPLESTIRENDMAKSLTSLPDHFIGETVTCHAEKPIKKNEVWVYVNDNEDLSKSYSSIQIDEYIIQAGNHIDQAQKFELIGEYEEAFGFYKEAMACLLTGISDEKCRERKNIIEEKIKKYAERAENVYALHMSKKKEKDKEIMTSCTEALKQYKVISIIDKVLLVLNKIDDKRYVIKVLEKSPCPVDKMKKTVIPQNVPYMVKLIKYFENENSIFLVLQYANGGKLFDYVNDCFQSYENQIIKYKSIDADSPIEEKNEKSYFDIIRDYTTDTARKVFGGYNESISVLNKNESNNDDDDDDKLNDNLEISYLVENSQKLLESIKNTLEQSDYVTDNLTKELNDIESALGKEMPDGFIDSANQKRSRSVARSRFERRFSVEDLLESRSRTASSSLDRSGQWSRLNGLLESSPILSESKIRDWAAEIFVALESLHRLGVMCRDLHPENILLDERRHILLTFQLNWNGVDASISEDAVTDLYVAPEVRKIFPVTPVADWWSYGALLFHLLTGKSLSSCYPSGIFSHTIITFPEFLSPEACSLLTELLRYDPLERLGGGVNGSDDIKCHPFFSSINWQLVYEN